MPFVFIYLIKLSLALVVVYAFYHFVLRRLTFYNWNRWYLLGYSTLAFLIPFIDVSGWLESTELQQSDAVNWVPSVNAITNSGAEIPIVENQSGIGIWEVGIAILFVGTLIMLSRLLIQFISFRKMMRNSLLISENGLKIYHVNASIIPFSFGNSIFINQDLHDEDELRKIVAHEFIHVKQRHSVDIILSELLCVFNWFNPVAWLIRKSIRQNLEFIADNKVIEHGVNRKEYQYLLLKVIGNSRFSIANQFNFSSLKKRIAMMNKIKSARVHLLRFLFVLPLLSVLLLAFRGVYQKKDTLKPEAKVTAQVPTSYLEYDLSSHRDTPPPPPPPTPPAAPDAVIPTVPVVPPAPPLPPKSKAPALMVDDIAPTAPTIPVPAIDMKAPPVAPVKAVTAKPAMQKSTSMVFSADTVRWSSKEGHLFMSGKATGTDFKGITINADIIAMKQDIPLILVDGKPAQKDADYSAGPGSWFNINSLTPADAVKKYGSSGKLGAIEVRTIKPFMKASPEFMFDPFRKKKGERDGC
jgi:beta-lactamase regulating signal transducer with metallopeptidase domain